MEDLVSCVVPTFNRAHFIKDVIESTLNQTHPHWELVIVDDKSTDNTAELTKAYGAKDPRIKYFLNPKKGVSSARNHGIQMSKGLYVAFLDDDDINLPHRFESQMNAMKKSGNGFIVSGFQTKDRNTGTVLEEIKLELKASCSGFPSRWMIRRDLLEKVGGFSEGISILEDIELSARLSQHETFALHDDIVTVMFETQGSLSSATANTLRARLILLEMADKYLLPLESAWWHFTAGADYYAIGEKSKADQYLKIAAERDQRGVYRLAYQYFKLANGLNGPFRRLNLKVLATLREYNFPMLVRHPIITND